MSRTRILVAVLVLVALMQLYPERAGTIELAWTSIIGCYAAIWAARRYGAERRQRQAAAALAVEDEDLYRRYKTELDTLRGRFDSQRDLSDLTSLPKEYTSALAALHDRYQDMLARKFGPR